MNGLFKYGIRNINSSFPLHSSFQTFRNISYNRILKSEINSPKTVIDTPMDNSDLKSLTAIFIEGPAAAGKSQICRRLEKMGYAVHHENFVELCSHHPHLDPKGALMSIHWITLMTEHLYKLSKLNKIAKETGKGGLKDGILFFDRSPLTPHVYSRFPNRSTTYLLDCVSELREVFGVKMLLCDTDPEVLRQRRISRYYMSTSEEKVVRKDLGEVNEEFQTKVQSKYKELQKNGWFDLTLNTTDTKQATSNLLEMLNIPFTLPGKPPSENGEFIRWPRKKYPLNESYN